MSDMTSDVKTETDTDRRIPRICRRVAKQRENLIKSLPSAQRGWYCFQQCLLVCLFVCRSVCLNR